MSNLINLSELPHGLGRNFVAPRAAVQGALFSSLVFRGRTARPAFTEPTLVAEYGNTRVMQTSGEQLDQGDADVYFELVRRAVEQDEVCLNIKSDEFLTVIGRERGTENRIWLEASIERLKNACFEFSIMGLPFMANMLASVERNFDSKTAADFVITLSEDMSQAFEAGKTIIKTSERMALGTDTLAKALHSFFSSHSKQFESKIGVEKLMAITGRQSMRKDRFCAGLAESIAKLRAVTGWIIKFEGSILKVKQSATVTKAESKPKQLTTTPKASGATRAAAASEEARKMPEPGTHKPAWGWDAIYAEGDLWALDLMQLVLLMDKQAKANYDAEKTRIDPLNFEAKKELAILLLDEQLYIEKMKKREKALADDI